MKNSVLRSVLLTAALVLVAGGLNLALAQGDGPGSTGPVPGAPVAVPIDGGASLLLAAGAAFGLRRLRKMRRS